MVWQNKEKSLIFLFMYSENWYCDICNARCSSIHSRHICGADGFYNSRITDQLSIKFSCSTARDIGHAIRNLFVFTWTYHHNAYLGCTQLIQPNCIHTRYCRRLCAWALTLSAIPGICVCVCESVCVVVIWYLHGEILRTNSVGYFCLSEHKYIAFGNQSISFILFFFFGHVFLPVHDLPGYFRVRKIFQFAAE